MAQAPHPRSVDPRPVGEDELHAYVDDRLDPERRAAVEARLAADPALRARIADWQAQRDGLCQALAFAHAEPVPARLSVGSLAEARLHAARHSRPWLQAAAILLALALGATGGWVAHGPRRPSEIARLKMEAASAYRLFGTEDAAAVEISAAAADAAGPGGFARWLGRRIGRQVAVPDLSASGYQLLGGRILAAMYGPAAILIYQDAHQQRITLYIQPMRLGEPTPMQQVNASGVDGYAWIDQQIGFSVLSDGVPDRLHAIANQVKAARL